MWMCDCVCVCVCGVRAFQLSLRDKTKHAAKVKAKVCSGRRETMLATRHQNNFACYVSYTPAHMHTTINSHTQAHTRSQTHTYSAKSPAKAKSIACFLAHTSKIVRYISPLFLFPLLATFTNSNMNNSFNRHSANLNFYSGKLCCCLFLLYSSLRLDVIILFSHKLLT